MRWKLLIITSLVAALISVGGCLALVYWMQGLLKPLSAPPLLLAAIFIIPFIMTTLATIFVYRHTARRRKLQATLTAMLAIILTLAALFTAQILLRRPAADTPLPTPTPHNITWLKLRHSSSS